MLSPPPSESRRTLSADSIRFLEQEGSICPPLLANCDKRSISLAVITPATTSSNSSSSNDTTTYSIFSDAQGSLDNLPLGPVVEIPMILESEDTISFMGFDQPTAATLWANHVRCRNQSDADEWYEGFLPTALSHNFSVSVTRDALADEPDTDWISCMTRLGISEQLQRAIMDESFRDIRLTGSCKAWLMDAVKWNFHSLEQLEEHVMAGIEHRRNVQMRIGDCRRGGANTTATQESCTSALSTQSGSISPAQTLSSASTSISAIISSTIAPLPKSSTASSATPIVTTASGFSNDFSGHTILWRGGSRVQASSFLNPTTGKLELK